MLNFKVDSAEQAREIWEELEKSHADIPQQWSLHHQIHKKLLQHFADDTTISNHAFEAKKGMLLSSTSDIFRLGLKKYAAETQELLLHLTTNACDWNVFSKMKNLAICASILFYEKTISSIQYHSIISWTMLEEHKTKQREFILAMDDNGQLTPAGEKFFNELKMAGSRGKYKEMFIYYLQALPKSERFLRKYQFMETKEGLLGYLYNTGIYPFPFKQDKYFFNTTNCSQGLLQAAQLACYQQNAILPSLQMGDITQSDFHDIGVHFLDQPIKRRVNSLALPKTTPIFGSLADGHRNTDPASVEDHDGAYHDILCSAIGATLYQQILELGTVLREFSDHFHIESKEFFFHFTDMEVGTGHYFFGSKKLTLHEAIESLLTFIFKLDSGKPIQTYFPIIVHFYDCLKNVNLDTVGSAGSGSSFASIPWEFS